MSVKFHYDETTHISWNSHRSRFLHHVGKINELYTMCVRASENKFLNYIMRVAPWRIDDTIWQCEAAPFGGSGSQCSIADTDREFEMQAVTLWEQIESLTDWSIYPCYAVSKTRGKVHAYICMHEHEAYASSDPSWPHGHGSNDLCRAPVCVKLPGRSSRAPTAYYGHRLGIPRRRSARHRLDATPQRRGMGGDMPGIYGAGDWYPPTLAAGRCWQCRTGRWHGRRIRLLLQFLLPLEVFASAPLPHHHKRQ
jgi:hypothetical protein